MRMKMQQLIAEILKISIDEMKAYYIEPLFDLEQFSFQSQKEAMILDWHKEFLTEPQIFQQWFTRLSPYKGKLVLLLPNELLESLPTHASFKQALADNKLDAVVLWEKGLPSEQVILFFSQSKSDNTTVLLRADTDTQHQAALLYHQLRQPLQGEGEGFSNTCYLSQLPPAFGLVQAQQAYLARFIELKETSLQQLLTHLD